MFLTEKQWTKVGTVIAANPGMREIVVVKDELTGNAELDFHGVKNHKHTSLRGNVYQFPLDRMAPPKPSRGMRILDGIVDTMQGLYIELGIWLGYLEEDLEKEAV